MNRFVKIPWCIAVVLGVHLSIGSAPAAPATGCNAFTWDVSRELSLMAQDPARIDAGIGAGAPVRIDLDRSYRVRLSPQETVRLASRPGKPMLDDGANAGLLVFRVPHAGAFRVAISTGHWIDVIDGDTVLPSGDFQGQRGCESIHKIVQFELPAGRELVLQFSGGADTDVDVVIIAVPPPDR